MLEKVFAPSRLIKILFALVLYWKVSVLLSSATIFFLFILRNWIVSNLLLFNVFIHPTFWSSCVVKLENLMPMSFLIVDTNFLSILLQIRIRVGDFSNQWLLLIGRTCRGAFSEKGLNSTSISCSHYTRRLRINEDKIAGCFRCRSIGRRLRLKRCRQFGCLEAPWAWYHIYQIALLESHTVREVRVPRCRCFGESCFLLKIILWIFTWKFLSKI